MKKIYLIFLLLVVIFLGYYFWQGKSFSKQKIIQEIKTSILNKEPAITTEEKEEKLSQQAFFLEIDKPKNGEVVNTQTIVIYGKTVSEAEVFVNDQRVKADKEGNFSLSINLDEGENNLLIVANDKDGNFKEKELTVTLELLE